MGDFSAEDIAYTTTGYKISKYDIFAGICSNSDLVNVDKSKTTDGSTKIADLRSVGAVMIKMLTRRKISHSEPLKFPSGKTDSSKYYMGCESFLEIASKEETDIRSYRKQLVLLKDVQLATWHIPKEETDVGSYHKQHLFDDVQLETWHIPKEGKELELKQLERSHKLSSEILKEQLGIL